jgi:cytochrome P450
MEGALLIATIAQQWKMSLAPGQRVEPKAMITLRPRYGMRMMVEARKHSFAAKYRNVETASISV